jgi:putrescine transport system substrate-binding protein
VREQFRTRNPRPAAAPLEWAREDGYVMRGYGIDDIAHAPGHAVAPLLRAALLFTVAAITACGGGNSDADTDAGLAETRIVNVYNWTNYIAPNVLEEFTKRTGIRVNYDVFDSNELLETKLLTGGSGYDVVVPPSTFLARQIEAGVFRELDRSRIRNWSNLDPEVMRRAAQSDPGNRYAVPYMWGVTGIGYNADQVSAALPGAPLNSWRMIFDPLIVSKLDCGVVVVDSAVDVIPATLIYLGKDPNSESPEDLQRVEATLSAVRQYVRVIPNQQSISALANGEVCVALTWNGAALQARDRALDAAQKFTIAYSTPREGAVMWFDTLAIPADAPHPDNAHAFIDFLQLPQVAAANAAFLRYASANAAAYPLLDESARSDPAIYPPAELRSALHPDLADSAEHSRRVNRVWTRFVTGT